jgi:hypothetical protein
MFFLALSSHELKKRADIIPNDSSNDKIEKDEIKTKKYHCYICGNLCYNVVCWKCKKVTCMLHRTLVQAGVICNKCRKENALKNNNDQEL